MPRTIPLNDVKIRNAKAGATAVRMFDGHGLYIEITPAGSKCWRLKYRWQRREKSLSLGQYPEIGLKEARGHLAAARVLLANGIDPSAARKVEKAAQGNTFEAVAREWLGKHTPRWTAAHAGEVRRHLVMDIGPWLGDRPVGKVTAPEALSCIQRIEARGSIETARRALRDCARVFAYALSIGLAERNPAGELRGALTPPAKVRHHAAIIEPKAVGALLRTIRRLPRNARGAVCPQAGTVDLRSAWGAPCRGMVRVRSRCRGMEHPR